MLIAALFIVARTCCCNNLECCYYMKQPKCLLTEEWIKKMGYIYTMEYYLDIKRNEIGSFVETPKDCHAEHSKSEIEHKYHILMHICEIWKNWYR